MKFRDLVLVTATVVLGWNTITPASAQINTDRVMIIGRNALYLEDYVLSIQYFNQVINAKPHLAEPYFYRAVAKLELGDYKGSEEDCNQALQRNTLLIRAYLCRSYARMNLKDYKGAIEDCEKGLEFDQENLSFLQNKALCQLNDKQYDPAERSLKELETRDPKYVYTHMMYGQLHIERGDTLAAVEDFSRAIAIDRHFAPALSARAYANLLLENYANAVPDLDEAIRLEPEDAGYYNNRALARYHLNNLRGTLEDFDRVIELDPENELALYNRGLIRSQVGDLNRAIEDFDKVIKLDPTHFTAIYNRALLRGQTGNLKGAIQDLTLVVEEYPTFTPALYQRSDIKKKAGDAKGADRDYFAAWNLESKVKAEREDRRKHPAKYAAADSVKEVEKEKKRDIDRFNRIILAEADESTPTHYNDPLKGRVQDRHVDVELEDNFTLTFYEKNEPGITRPIMDLTTYLASFQQAGLKDYLRLLITNREQPLNDQQVAEHFKAIDQLSGKIAQQPTNSTFLLARAIEFALVQDINSALEDLDHVIKLDPNHVLAYFIRANLKYRRLDIANEDGSPLLNGAVTTGTATTTTASGAGKSGTASTGMSSLFGSGSFGMDYGVVMSDYESVIKLAPTFIYAWFNRGNIRCLQRDYRNALLDYTKAIEINPEFAYAWFNRGITHIYLGNRAQGISDLRMAGQLGMYKAYNLIKRFEN